MKKNMLKKLFIFSTILLLGCQKNINNFSPVYDVPDEFKPIIARFIEAAAARGHTLHINNLIIRYDSTLKLPYCAKSNIISAQNDVQKIISISSNTQCWENSVQFETLVFHEMGHCILGRDHDTDKLPNGTPKSIMYPNDITLYTPCIYVLGDSCNLLYRRIYYLDELFDPVTPVPDWGK